MTRLEMVRDYLMLCVTSVAISSVEYGVDTNALIATYALALGYKNPVGTLRLSDAIEPALVELREALENRLPPEPAKTRFASIVE